MFHDHKSNRPGASVFFTVCLAQQGDSLLVDQVATLRHCVRRVMAKRPFRIDAWVVLPDHMHAVWTLPWGDANYAERWGAIKAQFTYELRRPGADPAPPPAAQKSLDIAVPDTGWSPQPRARPKPIWRKRFWEHHLSTAPDLRAAVAYCWYNPVKHGLAARPQDWLYSSVHRDMRVDAALPLAMRVGA